MQQAQGVVSKMLQAFRNFAVNRQKKCAKSKILNMNVRIRQFKDMSDDNWALFYTFSSEVSEKPGFRNNNFFPNT
jgi:hypothetical protein